MAPSRGLRGKEPKLSGCYQSRFKLGIQWLRISKAVVGEGKNTSPEGKVVAPTVPGSENKSNVNVDISRLLAFLNLRTEPFC